MSDCKLKHVFARNASLDEESVHAFADQGLVYAFQRLAWPGDDGFQLHANARRSLLELRHVRLGEGIGLVEEHADTARSRNKLAHQFQTFAGHLCAAARLS